MNSDFPLELLDDEAMAACFDQVTAEVIHELFADVERHSELVELLGSSLTQLHVLAALTRELNRRLPEAVAFARAQAFSWDEIGVPLGLTGSTSRRRYHTDTDGRTPGAHPHPTTAT